MIRAGDGQGCSQLCRGGSLDSQDGTGPIAGEIPGSRNANAVPVRFRQCGIMKGKRSD